MEQLRRLMLRTFQGNRLGFLRVPWREFLVRFVDKRRVDKRFAPLPLRLVRQIRRLDIEC
jgi:hypothetical protein